MKNKIIIFALILASIGSLTSCKNEKAILQSSKEETETVMIIDGFEVPYELYRYVALNYRAQYESGKTDDIWLGESGQALLKELNEDVKNTISTMYTTISLCKEYDINIDDKMILDVVDIEMDNIYESYDNDYKAYAEYISTYNMNDSVYRFIVRNDVLTEELFNAMISRNEIITDENWLMDLFNSDDFIRVKQILISSDNGKTDEENLAHAEDILNRIKSGADFDTLIQTEGQDLYMFNNNDGYYMMKGSYYKEFEEASFSLDIGEISDIVKSSAGYSIIKRYDKESEYINKNFDNMAQIYFDSVYNIKLEEHREKLQIETTELYDNYTIFTMK